MARNKLTDAKIKALDKPGMYSDGDGLFLRVRDGGSRQWFFVYRRGTIRTEIGLGGYGSGTAPVALRLAREKADAIRDQLARGIDPRPGRRKVATFADVMRDVLAVKTASSRNAKHAAQWKMTLEKYAADLHDKPVAEITVDDVIKVLQPIWHTTPETADRLRMRIAAVIDHARARKLFTGDNPAAWRGNLEHLLPARNRLQRGHHAAAPYASMPTIMAGLRGAKGTSARAVEFAALTAARSGEVRGSAWDEIDIDDAIWTIPATRMKSGREHVVPLSARALDILAAQREVATGDLVFGGDRDGKPISDTAMTKALRRASGDSSTLHGTCRSAFRDWCGDQTSFPREVAEAALAHVIGDQAEQAYRRGTAIEKRRELMAAWAAFCAGEKK